VEESWREKLHRDRPHYLAQVQTLRSCCLDSPFVHQIAPATAINATIFLSRISGQLHREHRPISIFLSRPRPTNKRGQVTMPDFPDASHLHDCRVPVRSRKNWKIGALICKQTHLVSDARHLGLSATFTVLHSRHRTNDMVSALDHPGARNSLIVFQLIRIRSREGNFRFEFTPNADISELVGKVGFASCDTFMRY
jgi:hypothetical protein